MLENLQNTPPGLLSPPNTPPQNGGDGDRGSPSPEELGSFHDRLLLALHDAADADADAADNHPAAP